MAALEYVDRECKNTISAFESTCQSYIKSLLFISFTVFAALPSLIVAEGLNCTRRPDAKLLLAKPSVSKSYAFLKVSQTCR